MSPLFPGSPAPSQAQGDTRRNNNTGGGQVCSPRVSSRSNYRSSQSAGTWNLLGWQVHQSAQLGRQVAGASLLSCVLPASSCLGGIAGSWAVSPSSLGSRA